MQPGHHFAQIERLAHVIVRAAVETSGDLVRRAAPREHQDRDQPPDEPAGAVTGEAFDQIIARGSWLR